MDSEGNSRGAGAREWPSVDEACGLEGGAKERYQGLVDVLLLIPLLSSGHWTAQLIVDVRPIDLLRLGAAAVFVAFLAIFFAGDDAP